MSDIVMSVFGVPASVIFGQLMLGLINGSFYAMLSMGLALIFGMLNIVNFAHGAQFMIGAFLAWMLASYMGVGYWWALILVPLVSGLAGIAIERTLIARTYRLDHLYGLVLTFGLSLVGIGTFHSIYGSAGLPYTIPPALEGGVNLGFMFLPWYRAWVVGVSLVICFSTYFLIEKTSLGAHLRAATERPALTEAFGINVQLLVTLTYGAGVALAALAGVLAAPIYSVNPHMGADLLIVVFAVVVIGGMGSILGAIVSGFTLGLFEGLTKLFYPTASSFVIFIVMAIAIVIKSSASMRRSR